MLRFLTSTTFLCFGSQLLLAQNEKLQLTLSFSDSNNTEISGVVVNSSQNSAVSDKNGNAVLNLPTGKHHLKITHFNYQDEEIDVELDSSRKLNIKLRSINKVEEVVVFSKEGKGLTTKTIIDRKAMEHLQPSSLTDLMELLPGGLARTPNLSTNNRAILRENRGELSYKTTDYNTSALGTQFMIDGNVINSNADMQVSLDNRQFLEGPQA